MQIDRRQIESALKQKGFVSEDKKHHRYFYHEVGGKRTGSYTYVSRGSKFKAYPKTLLKQMRKQLFLDTTSQVVDLFNCPIDGDDYNRILKEKGLL